MNLFLACVMKELGCDEISKIMICSDESLMYFSHFDDVREDTKV